MQPPTEKRAVLRQARQRWDALHALIEGLPVHEIEQPLGDGWSVKVHIAHIAAWEASTAALLQREHRGDALGVPRELWESEDTDAVNDVIAKRAAARDWVDIERESLATHNQLLTLVESMTQEELDLPYSDYAPYDPPYNATPVIAWVNGNTWDHYNEHIAWITAGLAAN